MAPEGHRKNPRTGVWEKPAEAPLTAGKSRQRNLIDMIANSRSDSSTQPATDSQLDQQGGRPGSDRLPDGWPPSPAESAPAPSAAGALPMHFYATWAAEAETQWQADVEWAVEEWAEAAKMTFHAAWAAEIEEQWKTSEEWAADMCAYACGPPGPPTHGVASVLTEPTPPWRQQSMQAVVAKSLSAIRAHKDNEIQLKDFHRKAKPIHPVGDIQAVCDFLETFDLGADTKYEKVASNCITTGVSAKPSWGGVLTVYKRGEIIIAGAPHKAKLRLLDIVRPHSDRNDGGQATSSGSSLADIRRAEP